MKHNRMFATLLGITTSLSLTLGAVLTAVTATAATPPNTNYDSWRWFEVEVLIFKHTTGNELQENFPLPVKPIATGQHTDFLTDWMAPAVWNLTYYLPKCSDMSAQEMVDLEPCSLPGEHDLIPRADGSPHVSRLSHLDSTPVVIDGYGADLDDARKPFLMPAANHELTELREQLSARGQAQPMLHLSYRQPVFGRGDNYPVHLFAGHNFSDSYDYFGFKTAGADFTSNPFADSAGASSEQLGRIRQLLQLVDDNAINFKIGDDPTQQLLPLRPEYWPKNLSDQVWELDGLLHIYLVGNYLHIDSNFNLREETRAKEATPTMTAQAEQALQGKVTEQEFLRAYPFAQVRRVISHETHYFDHPKMGIVVQVRRTDKSARRD
ncbi:MAG: CsiV family protein [Idiomarina sp.]